MKVEPYDFRRPPRLAVDLEQRLCGWLRDACGIIAEKLGAHIPFPVEVQFHSVETARPEEALGSLPDPAVGYYLRTGLESPVSLMVFTQQAGVALVCGMLGESPEELPPQRELTPVECSLFEYALQELVAGLEEAWPGAEPQRLEIAWAESRPKRSREFRADQNVVICRLGLVGPFGEQPWCWLWPQEELQEQLARVSLVTGGLPQEDVRLRLESLAHQIPVEVSVKLGDVELHVSELARLRAGDLVILDQRVTEPLIACVAGEERLRVWPGRVGSRQAFQIESF